MLRKPSQIKLILKKEDRINYGIPFLNVIKHIFIMIIYFFSKSVFKFTDNSFRFLCNIFSVILQVFMPCPSQNHDQYLSLFMSRKHTR